jgi:hypothetical protein
MKHINEDIEGKGIPKGYPQRVKRRAKQRLGLPNEEENRGWFSRFFPRQQGAPTHNIMQVVDPLMRTVQEVQRFCRGHERQLEGLAYDVIMTNFKDIIKRHKIRFEIRLQDPRNIARNLYENVEDETFKKRITNLITQGEAKNTKNLLHTDQVKDGLREIFGREWRHIFDLFVRLTELADKLDWLSDPQERAQMMNMNPQGLAGSVRVEFDINESSKPSKGVLIKAYGLDFTMLLHESVKGIFQVLSSGAIPSDREIARETMRRTGLHTEPEDWQYGPEIAADLREFINENSKVSLFPDVRYEVYRLMVDKRTMPTSEFLKFMEGILSKTKEAREKMDEIIDLVIKRLTSEKKNDSNKDKHKKEMEEYNKKMAEYEKEMEEYNRKMEEYEKEMEEYNRKMGEYENSKNNKSEIDEILSKPKKDKEEQEDYSTYSQSQLQSVLNRALDSGDYDVVKKISPYLRESKKYNLR